MRKPGKTAGTIPISLAVTADLRNDLMLLAASRKLAGSRGVRSITHIVDAAILDLAAVVRRGARVSFVTVPRSPVRISVRTHHHAREAAILASRNVNVRISDFVRTALSRYLRKHRREIPHLTKRSRKSAR